MRLLRVRKKSLAEKLKEKGITVLGIAYDGEEPKFILIEDNPKTMNASKVNLMMGDYILEEEDIEKAEKIFVGPIAKRIKKLKK